MNKWLAISLPVLSASAVVSAQANSSPPIVLWKSFTTASSKAEIKAFKATQPNRKVEIIPGCKADMGYREIKGRMVTISFLGLDKESDCFARLLDDLRTRLGQPEVSSASFGSGIGTGTGGSVVFSSTGVMLIWRDGDKKTKLIKSPGPGYNLFFTVRDDKYLY